MGLSSKKTKTKSSETIAPNPIYAAQINDAAAQLRPGFDKATQVADSYQPGLMAASKYYGDTLDGKYLEGNPYLDDVIGSTNRDITDTVNSQFANRFGSGYHTKALVRGLGDNEARLRYGDYATERGYQNDAGRNLAGIATTATALPLLPGQSYADSISGLLGRYLQSDGKTTTKQSGGFLGDLLLAMAANAGSFGKAGG